MALRTVAAAGFSNAQARRIVITVSARIQTRCDGQKCSVIRIAAAASPLIAARHSGEVDDKVPSQASIFARTRASNQSAGWVRQNESTRCRLRLSSVVSPFDRSTYRMDVPHRSRLSARWVSQIWKFGSPAYEAGPCHGSPGHAPPCAWWQATRRVICLDDLFDQEASELWSVVAQSEWPRDPEVFDNFSAVHH